MKQISLRPMRQQRGKVKRYYYSMMQQNINQALIQ